MKSAAAIIRTCGLAALQRLPPSLIVVGHGQGGAQTMSRRNAWVLAFVLGALEALAVGLFPLGGYTLALVTLAVFTRGERTLPALSGFLMGLGITWLLLFARASLGSGQTDNPTIWILLGILPVVIGGILGLAILSASRAKDGSGKSARARRRLG
jgi:hypothetical protein